MTSEYRFDSCFLNPHHSPRRTRTADVSRLLDPSYASPAPSSSSQTKVYIDTDGQVHDPDYRLFPAVRRQSGRQRRRTDSSLSPKRPSWELDLDNDEYALEDEDEESSLQSDEFFPRRLSPSPLYPTFPTTPLSSSYDSDESAPLESAKKKHHLFQPHRSSFDSAAHPRSRGLSIERYNTYHAGDGEEEEPSESPSSSESTPASNKLQHHQTCGEVMKKEWYSLSLSWNIGMFRIKRKVRRAFSPRR